MMQIFILLVLALAFKHREIGTHRRQMRVMRGDSSPFLLYLTGYLPLLRTLLFSCFFKNAPRVARSILFDLCLFLLPVVAMQSLFGFGQSFFWFLGCAIMVSYQRYYFAMNHAMNLLCEVKEGRKPAPFSE